MTANDRARFWNVLVDWEIEVKDAAADLRAGQARYDEAISCHAKAREELAAFDAANREEIRASTN